MGFSWTAKGILAALLAVAGAAGLSSCGNRGSAGEAVKIGAALPLSGDSAAWGQQGRWGAEIAVAEANGSAGLGESVWRLCSRIRKPSLGLRKAPSPS